MSHRDLRVTIEITDQEIRILRLNSYQTFDGFDCIPLAKGIIEQGIVRQPQEFINVLQEYFKRLGIRGKVKAKLAIPMSNGFIREYTLPWVRKRERIKLMNYLADEEIPIPEEERTFDYWMSEEKHQDKYSDKQLHVILSGIRKTVLSTYSSCFERAGFHLESIGFTSVAWAYALNQDKGERTLWIKETGDAYQLLFYHGPIPEVTPLMRITAEESHLAYFLPLQEKVDIHQVVVSEGTEARMLGQRVCAYLQKEKGTMPHLRTVSEIVSALNAVKWKSEEPEKFLAVLGLAHQRSREAPQNFWRETVNRKQQERNQWITVLLLIALCFVGLKVRDFLTQERNKLELEVVQFEANRAAMVREADQSAKQAQEWLQLIRRRTSVGKELSKLNGLSGNGIRFEQLDYREGKLVIQGSAAQPSEVQEILNRLQTFGWDQPRLQSYAQDLSRNSGEGRIEFSLTANRNDTSR